MVLQEEEEEEERKEVMEAIREFCNGRDLWREISEISLCDESSKILERGGRKKKVKEAKLKGGWNGMERDEVDSTKEKLS